MSTSRRLKILCILLLILPQASFFTTVVCHVVQAPGILNDVQFFLAFAHAVPSIYNAIPIFTTCPVLKPPPWHMSHTSSMKDFPIPGWSHILCSPPWNLWRSPLQCQGVCLLICLSSYNHKSLHSIARASQEALQNNQTISVITEPLSWTVCPTLLQ